MKIIIGLGNPGKKYEKTRHNVGFMLLDRLGKEEQLVYKKSFKSQSFLARKRFEEDVLFVKPRTFMNNSGRTLAWFRKTYNIPLENFLIVYDDMDLDLSGIIQILFDLLDDVFCHQMHSCIVHVLGFNEYSYLPACLYSIAVVNSRE